MSKPSFEALRDKYHDSAVGAAIAAKAFIDKPDKFNKQVLEKMVKEYIASKEAYFR